MRSFPKSIRKASSDPDRRSVAGRFRAQHLRSRMGPVMDLSITGMSVLSTCSCDRIVGEQSNIWICMDKGEKHEFRVQVRWSRKLGFRRHRVGLSFVDLTPQQRMMLTEFGSRAGSHEFGWGKTG